MGDTGPCGPCSEIFIDQRRPHWGGPPGSQDEDGDRFLEFWNLVFMQYEQFNDGPSRACPLPKPSIDTGMGLERIACVLQGVDSVLRHRSLRTLIRASEETHRRQGGRRAAREPQRHRRSSALVVFPHRRRRLPSNEGRGYVLRRIMRRAMRHAHILGAREPLMYNLVGALVREMGEAYPELIRAEPLIDRDA
jgi:alanyl-tRNA synthetase